ncbi:MAG TPA: hypothetical protein VGB97_00175 [Candidatus Paceibacterota bacterium]|jgi:primosomal protein N'
MYVVDVIPFSPGAPAGSLSYRSPHPLVPGDVVEVKLRRRTVPAIVVSVMDAIEAKATLKAASFALSSTISKPVSTLPIAVMDAVARTSEWHAAPLGSVLSQLLAEWIDTEAVTLPDAPGGGFLVRPVECPLAERKAAYRAAIAAAEKRERAVLLVVSTLAEVEYWSRAFADLSPVVLSGALKDEKRKAALAAARASSALVIATPHFAFAQIAGLDAIIIDRVGAGGFRLQKRPYLDVRVALLELARARKLTLIYGDFPLPLEFRSGARKLAAHLEPITVLDARVERAEGEAWSAVPAMLKERIADELLAGGRVAVFAARKGYAPVVICRDCGEALKDERGKVYAFTTERGTRLFKTSDGKSVLSTKMRCPNCDSWNLLPLGVGVERVVEELRAAFPEAPCTLFDADTVRTYVGARRKLAPLAELGSIVVGTEAMAPWLLAASPAPVSLAAIASADTLLALPFWRARERFLRLGYLMQACAPRAIVATRLPEDAAVRTLKDPSDPAFFEEETALRQALGYPPFGTLISLTWQGSTPVLDALETTVRRTLGSHTVRSVPDRFVRGIVSKRTVVLVLPKDAWPDPELSQGLAGLPASVRVLVDPESFW